MGMLACLFIRIKNMTVAQLTTRNLILFDLDGTLVDSATDLFRAMNISLNTLQLPMVTEQQIRQWVGKGASKLCEDVLLNLLGEVEPSQHQQLYAEFLEVYAAGICVDSKPFPGVIDFLDYAVRQNITLACVTNKPQKLAEALLYELRLDQYFKLVVGGDSLEHKKPHPLPLLHCMDVLKSNTKQTLLIGDSSNDIEAARRAGVDCIVVSYGYNHGEDIHDSAPQQVVDDLRELIDH
jgi:phosphoglycolate phosphatase